MVDYQMLKESLEMFQLDGDSWKAVADEFKREIDLAEAGGSSSLKILPAFLSPPSGNEKGNYTAIDFGGSNLRVMQVQLLGLGLYRIAKQISRPLQDPQGRYDFTGPHR
jgi:hexokinase